MRLERCRTMLVLSAVLGSWACESNSGPVFERIEPPVPPEFSHRVDVFLVTDVASCAIGRACSSQDPDRCFYARKAGSADLLFEPAGLDFVPPDDPRIASAEQSACFHLLLDTAARDATRRAFVDLRSLVFAASGGKVDLELRVHELPPISAGFKRWERGTGLFLQPAALETQGLPLTSADTDYSFAVTGESTPDLGYLPKIDVCGGTNWQAQGGLAGTAYTWLSSGCATGPFLRWHFMTQSYFAMRDVTSFDDLYGNDYPECGHGVGTTRAWFPLPSDCARDPDAASCGSSNCSDETFAAHVFSAHWPSSPGLTGNHCRNHRLDFDETSVDAGGVCDRLGM
jgi:hypothetical protein